MSESTKEIERRRLSDSDAKTVVGVGSALAKASVGASVAAAFAAVGMDVPLGASVGATIATELSGVIFDVYKDRQSRFLSLLFRRKAELSPEAQERFTAQLETEAGSRIFETVWHQAAQTVDPEKLNHLAALLKNSLSSEELEEHHTHWLLKMLNELDAVQVIILQSYTASNLQNGAFRQQHQAIFSAEQPPTKPELSFYERYDYHRGRVPDDPQEKERWQEYDQKQTSYQIARERHSLYQSRLHSLVELGLLGIGHDHYQRRIANALTPLGAALLKIIDVMPDKEWGSGEQTNAVEALMRSEREASERESALRSSADEMRREHERELRGFAEGFKTEFERAARRYGRY